MVSSWIIVAAVVAAVVVTEGKEYKVGDSDGWTTRGNPDYKGWASSKTFKVGDTILFEYNTQAHDVLEVTKSDFDTCKADSPLKSYSSGEDSIPVKEGSSYYICGVPGHCDLGQKVEIKTSSTSGPSPKTSTPPTNAEDTPSGKSGAARGGAGWLVVVAVAGGVVSSLL